MYKNADSLEFRAEPLPWNILEWHYCISGPENSPYHGGFFHGSLVFTQQYPFKPPSIYMRTPNGRFQTNRRLCLSISDYHPGNIISLRLAFKTIKHEIRFFFLLLLLLIRRMESSVVRIKYLNWFIELYARG